MSEKLKKIDKEFLLTDDSINCYGYRLLTAGFLMSEYQKNPIGYHMHNRETGVLVKWADLRAVGDKVYGKPCINMSHARGQQTVDEIENGFLNAASCGHFVVLAVSDKQEDYLADQTGPTISKWFPREISLVDIPGNFNALTELFDKNDNPLKIEDLKASFNLPNMKQYQLTAEQLLKLNLKAESDSTAVATAIDDLIAKAAKVPGLENDLASANSAKKKAEDDLAALNASTVTKEVNDLLAAGLTAGKTTKEEQTILAEDYKTNPTGLKRLLDARPAYSSITDKINHNNQQVTDLAGKSWDELDKSGKLENLKATNLELFKAKYKEKFEKDYNG